MNALRILLKWAILLALWFGLPLAGLWLVGGTVTDYLGLLPKTRPPQSMPFSWPIFIVLAIIVTAIVAPYVVRVLSTEISCVDRESDRRQFPLWGWLSVVWLVLAWVLAWNRFPWFAPGQQYTFTPLWVGYILIVNALTFQRCGHCMVLDRPTFLLLLFPLSAVFWWGLEYLNRFTENWYYVGTDDVGSWNYFLIGSIAFSTVLPAVLSTAEYMKTFPGINAGLKDFWSLGAQAHRHTRRIMIAIATAGLLGIGLWPESFFPLVWVAPLLLISVLQYYEQGNSILLNAMQTGDWRHAWRLALAGLICGFFWELWNVKSLAHWVYSVPYAQRFHIFEMPILGYAGYLPFGIMCGAFVEFAMPDQTQADRRGSSNHSIDP